MKSKGEKRVEDDPKRHPLCLRRCLARTLIYELEKYTQEWKCWRKGKTGEFDLLMVNIRWPGKRTLKQLFALYVYKKDRHSLSVDKSMTEQFNSLCSYILLSIVIKQILTLTALHTFANIKTRMGLTWLFKVFSITLFDNILEEVKNWPLLAAEFTQWLSILTALKEDLDSVGSTMLHNSRL